MFFAHASMVANPPVQPESTTDEEWAAFEAVREDGMTLDAAAAKLGCDRETVVRRVERYELKQYGIRLGRKLGRREPVRLGSLSAIRQF